MLCEMDMSILWLLRGQPSSVRQYFLHVISFHSARAEQSLVHFLQLFSPLISGCRDIPVCYICGYFSSRMTGVGWISIWAYQYRNVMMSSNGTNVCTVDSKPS